MQQIKSFTSYPLFILSLCAGFLFYKYILQIYPSVITHQLMGEFHLTGAGLGNLAATFYYAYMITQLFVGILLDKYSTRWLTSAAIFSCALGVILFSQAHSLLLAQLARGLMGVGVAFATVAYMKLAAVWFSPRQYAFVGGLLASAAMAGAIFGQAPLSFFIDLMGWRNCLYATGFVGFALAALFLLIVRDAPATHRVVETHTPIAMSDLICLLKNKQNWLLTFYGGLAFSPIAIFGGLWGNPFLQQAYHLSSTQAASMISLIFIGLGLGSPLLGILSDRLGKRRQVLFYSTLIALLALIPVLYCNFLPTWLLSTLLFIFGFELGAFMLVFTIGKEINKPALTATVIAMINTSDALLDSVTEPGIGKLLDLLWDGKIVNGVHYFSLQSYHIALTVLPAYLLVAMLLVIWIKEAKVFKMS
ncbi:MAG: MFS transporter [Gammaproteobacteria bacterium]|nr:MAG: MFS transporter [Gammaproteobacteria bacterium]